MIADLIQEAKKATCIDSESLYAHAYALYQAGQHRPAAEIFQILCARKPTDTRFWFGLGASLQESMDFEKALYAWAMAALLDPTNPYPHFHAAQCSCSLAQMSEAAAALQNAKELIDPAHPLKPAIDLLEERWRTP